MTYLPLQKIHTQHVTRRTDKIEGDNTYRAEDDSTLHVWTIRNNGGKLMFEADAIYNLVTYVGNCVSPIKVAPLYSKEAGGNSDTYQKY